jgi:hypothetical protein
MPWIMNEYANFIRTIPVMGDGSAKPKVITRYRNVGL